MPRSLPCSFASAFAAAFLLTPCIAFGASLSDEAVREAYILGQRNDKKPARFLKGYCCTADPRRSSLCRADERKGLISAWRK